jgi:hypothetical protein
MGKIVMLMSADAQKFVDGVQNMATIVVFPFQVIAIFTILFMVAGPIAGSIGLAYMIMICPLIRHFQNLNRQYREELLGAGDTRVSLVNEAISGIRWLWRSEGWGKW